MQKKAEAGDVFLSLDTGSRKAIPSPEGARSFKTAQVQRKRNAVWLITNHRKLRVLAALDNTDI
jgi:hypothetical protein